MPSISQTFQFALDTNIDIQCYSEINLDTMQQPVKQALKDGLKTVDPIEIRTIRLVRIQGIAIDRLTSSYIAYSLTSSLSVLQTAISQSYRSPIIIVNQFCYTANYSSTYVRYYAAQDKSPSFITPSAFR